MSKEIKNTRKIAYFEAKIEALENNEKRHIFNLDAVRAVKEKKKTLEEKNYKYLQLKIADAFVKYDGFFSDMAKEGHFSGKRKRKILSSYEFSAPLSDDRSLSIEYQIKKEKKNGVEIKSIIPQHFSLNCKNVERFNDTYGDYNVNRKMELYFENGEISEMHNSFSGKSTDSHNEWRKKGYEKYRIGICGKTPEYESFYKTWINFNLIERYSNHTKAQFDALKNEFREGDKKILSTDDFVKGLVRGLALIPLEVIQ